MIALLVYACPRCRTRLPGALGARGVRDHSGADEAAEGEAVMPSEYAQGVTYTVADLWRAFEAGAKEARANGGNPSDALISRAADAYCKMVHPLASEVEDGARHQ